MAALVAAGLAGCAQPGGDDAAVAPRPAGPPDPVAEFVEHAVPGQSGMVVIPSTGRSVQVRVVRSYAAASGRECREVQVSDGGPASRLICGRGSDWAEARPLLRGMSAVP